MNQNIITKNDFQVVGNTIINASPENRQFITPKKSPNVPNSAIDFQGWKVKANAPTNMK